jgi:antitoxin VapB
MRDNRDRLLIEPVRRRGFVALLKANKPLADEFHKIYDQVPAPEDAHKRTGHADQL